MLTNEKFVRSLKSSLKQLICTFAIEDLVVNDDNAVLVMVLWQNCKNVCYQCAIYCRARLSGHGIYSNQYRFSRDKNSNITRYR